MNNKFLAVLAACLSFIILQCTEPKPEPSSPTVVLSNPEYGGFDSQVQWGEHLVTITGCNDCHTPKKMGPMGPELDTSLRLSGHPSMILPVLVIGLLTILQWLCAKASTKAWLLPDLYCHLCPGKCLNIWVIMRSKRSLLILKRSNPSPILSLRLYLLHRSQ